MQTSFPEVFSALRSILTRQAGTLVIAEDTAGSFRLEGGLHPKHRKPIPVAWVLVGKAYVSFHHMGVCGQAALLKSMSPQLRARMQGKACFNFTTAEPRLLAELEDISALAFEALRRSPFMK
jgi:hypothetical protein